MSFQSPQFLWALFALAIPVIIHLFNFKRYKTVYFSNNRLLRTVQTRSRSFNRLKHLVIMTLRMLALAMLVLAFAQPFIPAENADENNAEYVSIYIDNSLSMKTKGPEGVLLDQARSSAIELIQALPENYQVQVITNDFEGKQQRYYTPAEAIKLVDEIKAGNAHRSIEDVESRISGAWQGLGQKATGDLQLFVISDFQQSQFSDLSSLDKEERDIIFLNLHPGTANSNLAIDSVWFDQPVLQAGFDQQVFVRLRNYGSSNVSVPVKMELNEQLAGAGEFEVPANAFQDVNFEIRPTHPGFYRGKVSIDAGEPYFDNEFYFSFSIGKPINILVIGEENADAFKRLYKDTAYNLQVSNISSLNYGQLNQMHLIILNQLESFPSGLVTSLHDLLQRGGNLVILPRLNENLPVNSVLDELGLPSIRSVVTAEVKAKSINYRDDIFRNVFNDLPENPQMPEAGKYGKFNIGGGFELISLENGDPLIARYTTRNGNILLFAVNFDPELSSLPRHPVVVPVLLNAALYSTSISPLYTAPGIKRGQEFTDGGSKDIPLTITAGENSFIPLQRTKGEKTEIYNLPAVTEPGIYNVTKKDSIMGLLAVNVDHRESHWNFISGEELENVGLSSTPTVITADAGMNNQIWEHTYSGKPLWHWFLVAAILFLLLEILILKIWK